MPRKKPSVVFKPKMTGPSQPTETVTTAHPKKEFVFVSGDPIKVDFKPDKIVNIASQNVAIEPISEPMQTMKQKRHEIYDWLVSIGCPGMKQGEKWRGYLKDMLVQYAELTAGVYKHQLKGLLAEAEKRAEQRRKS